MRRNNYYPLRQADQIVWLTNFSIKLPPLTTTLGLTTGQSVGATLDCNWLIYILQAWLPAERAWALACTDAVTEAQTGNGSVSVEDFEVLKEYADIWKRQFERKQKAESLSPIPPKPNFPETPFVAQRKTATGETMVKIIGQAWCENGKWVCQADGGLMVPVDEIIQNLKA
jgi:hypothetical protein